MGLESVSNKLMRIGKTMTVMITIPILLTLFLGTFGFVIGIIVFVLGLAGLFVGEKDKKKREHS